MHKLSVMVVVLFVSAGAVAQEKKAAPATAPAAPPKIEVPKPAKELDALKSLAKNWTCTGTATLPGPTPMTFNTKTKVTSKWDLNGHWADWKYEREKGKELPAVVAEGEWGYDSANKKYLMQGMDDWGGYINLSAATATADAISFDGDIVLMGQKMPAKFVFTNDAKAKKMHMTLSAGPTKLLDEDCK